MSHPFHPPEQESVGKSPSIISRYVGESVYKAKYSSRDSCTGSYLDPSVTKDMSSTPAQVVFTPPPGPLFLLCGTFNPAHTKVSRWLKRFEYEHRLHLPTGNTLISPKLYLETLDMLLEGEAAIWADDTGEVVDLFAAEDPTNEDVQVFKELFVTKWETGGSGRPAMGDGRVVDFMLGKGDWTGEIEINEPKGAGRLTSATLQYTPINNVERTPDSVRYPPGVPQNTRSSIRSTPDVPYNTPSTNQLTSFSYPPECGPETPTTYPPDPQQATRETSSGVRFTSTSIRSNSPPVFNFMSALSTIHQQLGEPLHIYHNRTDALLQRALLGTNAKAHGPSGTTLANTGNGKTIERLVKHAFAQGIMDVHIRDQVLQNLEEEGQSLQDLWFLVERLGQAARL